MLILFEGGGGNAPQSIDAKNYHAAIGSPSYPVLSDVKEQTLTITSYNGSGLPGKCVVTPDMVILGCETGHGDANLLEMIKQDAASR